MSIDLKDKASFLAARLFIALVTPLSLFWMLAGVVDELLFPLALFKWWQYLVIGLVGAGKIILNRLAPKRRRNFLSYFSEAVLSGLACYLLARLASGVGLSLMNWRTDDYHTIALFLACAGCWWVVDRLDAPLLALEGLAAFVEKKIIAGEPPATLQKEPRLGEAEAALKRLQFILLGFGILFGAAIAFFAYAGRPGGAFLWRAAGCGVTLFISRLFFGRYREQLRRYGAGLFTGDANRKTRLPPAILLLLFSAGVGLILASDRPLVDPAWFQIQPPRPPVMSYNNQQPTPPPGNEFNTQPDAADITPPPAPDAPPGTIWLLMYIIGGFIVLGMVLWPLLSAAGRRLPLSYRIKRLMEAIRNLAKAIASIFLQLLKPRKAGVEERRRRKPKPGMNLTQAEAIRARLKAGETSGVVRIFHKLMKWAARNRLPYRHGQTATEFMDHLSARFPEASGRLRLVLTVFERALFSDHLVGREVLRRYRDHVGAIIKLKPTFN